MSKIWKKQAWESQDIFDIFQRWLMLDNRDVHEAYRLASGRRFTDSGHLVVAPQKVLRAANGYEKDQVAWIERAKAFDAEQKRKELELWLKRRTRIRDKEFEVASMLLEKAREMLDWPIYQEETIEDDGKTIVRIVPTKWSLRDVSNMVKVGSEIARLAAEMEQSIHKYVFTLSAEAMRAVEVLENYGVSYNDVSQNFEDIIIETARQYEQQTNE